MKILHPLHSGMFFEHGDANFFRSAWIHGGLIHDRGATLHVFADARAGANQWRKIRLVRHVDRRGYRDDYIVRLGKLGGVSGDGQMFCRFEIGRINFAGRIDETFIAFNFFGREIKTDGFALLSEFNG